jgi:hypothetical protein
MMMFQKKYLLNPTLFRINLTECGFNEFEVDSILTFLF